MSSDIIELAELELTNAIVHPDRYNIDQRRQFVKDLYKYTDYREMLREYIARRAEYARLYPGDTKYLSQLDTYIHRLTKTT